MRGNPFYVDPGGDLLPGLSMLGQGLNIRREKQAVEDAETKRMKIAQEAIAAYKTNDPDQIAEFILKNPKIGETLGELYDKRRDYKREDYVDHLENMLTEIETTGSLKPLPGAEEPMIPSSEALLPPEPQGGLSGLAGGTPSPVTAPGKGVVGKQDIIRSIIKRNPDAGKKMLEYEFAKNDPDRYKSWKEVYRGEGGSGAKSSLKKLLDERQALLDQGLKEDDPKVKAYDAKIWPEESGAPTNLQKLINERATHLQNGVDPNDDIIKGYNARILGAAADKIYSPSPLKKFIQERNEYIDEGLPLNHPIIKAYDNKIQGIDIDIEELSQDEIDMWGAWVNATGKMPSVGRGKQATKIRAAILKSSARQALGYVRETNPDATPIEAAFEVIGTQADTKAIGQALGNIEKQIAAMGSFVQNMDAQIDKVRELAQTLDQNGIRIMNVPRRLWRSKIQGHADQAKYDMYLTEIESEIGKLAQGNAQSIAELSTRAQEKWDSIHDKNLSTKDMLDLLSETSHAARLRIRSVEDQLERTRKRMRNRQYTKTLLEGELPTVGSQEEFDKLESGDKYINKKTGKPMVKP